MRSKSKMFAVLLAIALVATSVPAMAQAFAKVQGKVVSPTGEPITSGTVEMKGLENGARYTLKIDKKGQYFSIGIQPGMYSFKLKDAQGNEIFSYDKVQVSLSREPDSMNTIDFDLKKEKAATNAAAGAMANQSGAETSAAPTAPPAAPDLKKLTPEQRKKIEEAQKQNAQIEQENAKIKGLNGMLAQARTAMQSGNPEQAVTVMTQATQADPTKDLLWSTLGDAHLASAKKAASGAERAPHYAEAAEAYKKALDIAGAAQPQDPKKLAQFNNNYAEALSKSGQVPPAIEAWDKAAQLDPTLAGTYYFNEGATLTNIGKADDAVKAFDKALQADPNRAEAYYYKGVNMLAKATVEGSKMTAPPGTAEAFNKYLEVAPDGPNAANAKMMLEQIGAKVETNYKKTKAAAPPKK